MIQCKKERLDQEVNYLFSLAEIQWSERKKLYNRFTRKHDEHDVKVNLEMYITRIAAGYFGGKEPLYQVQIEQNQEKRNLLTQMFGRNYNDDTSQKELQILIDYITDYNDNPAFFYNMVKDYLIKRAAYARIYQNDKGQVVFTPLNALQTIAVYDYSVPVNMIALLRKWEEDKEYVLELITDTEIKRYRSNKDKIDFNLDKKEGIEPISWGDVPGLAIENEDNLGIFEPVLTLINKYEQIIYNNANTFEYNDDAKLKIVGYRPDNELLIEQTDSGGNVVLDSNGEPIMIANPKRIAEDAAILRSKTFYTDPDGDVEWIIKNLNDTASENHKKTCLDMALMIAGVPNVTDQGFTNADNASALEKKFFPLEQALVPADRAFKKELLRMWEIIVNRINVSKNKNYEFRDINIVLQRNIPSNNKEVVDTWLSLKDTVSDKTIISNLPFELDPDTELALMQEQKQNNTRMVSESFGLNENLNG